MPILTIRPGWPSRSCRRVSLMPGGAVAMRAERARRLAGRFETGQNRGALGRPAWAATRQRARRSSVVKLGMLARQLVGRGRTPAWTAHPDPLWDWALSKLVRYHVRPQHILAPPGFSRAWIGIREYAPRGKLNTSVAGSTRFLVLHKDHVDTLDFPDLLATLERFEPKHANPVFVVFRRPETSWSRHSRRSASDCAIAPLKLGRARLRRRRRAAAARPSILARARRSPGRCSATSSSSTRATSV
jgi:hypothetical protein